MIKYHSKVKELVGTLEKDFEVLGDTVKEKEIDKIRKELFEGSMKKLIPFVKALEAVTKGETKKNSQLILAKINIAQGKVYKLISTPKTTNERLQHVVLDLAHNLKEILKEMKHLELEPWVDDKTFQRFPREIVKDIAAKFHATRDICIFENNMEEGDDLLSFRENMKNKCKTLLYGTDKRVDYCDTAREKGVDYVAKLGVHNVTHRCFDISINFLDEFIFSEDDYDSKFKRVEEDKFSMLFSKHIPTDDGYILFNLPYFKLPEMEKKMSYYIAIDDIYRVDDEIKNVFIVARKRKDKGQNEQKIRKALFMYDQLPSISEMKDYYINKGTLSQPKTFKPIYEDENDVIQEFKGFASPVERLAEFYTPVEKVLDLVNPLQEIKPEHVPGMATSEAPNGIINTKKFAPILGKDLEFTHMFCTKAVQQEMQEMKKVMHNGQEVDEVSNKKMVYIVSNIWTPDGEYIELLNTKEENTGEGVQA